MRLSLINWRRGILTGLLILSAVWFVSLIWGLTGKAHLAWNEAHQTRAGYEALEARRMKLRSDLDALSTARGQDAAVREAFGVAKDGEEVIVVVPPPSTSTTTSKSWWQKLFGWF